MSEKARQFRNALGCFATGVTVVTTREAGGAEIGLTANSFSSVSLEPPLVLWCIDKGSDTYDAFMAAEHFAINVLGADCADVSNAMARSGRNGLDGIPHANGPETGMPLLDDAISTFECAVQDKFEGGDHIIIVGRVLGYASKPEGAPLLYFRGKYATTAGE